MNKSDLIREVHERMDKKVSLKELDQIIGAMLNVMSEKWAAAGSVDTDLSFLSFLELYRTDVAQC